MRKLILDLKEYHKLVKDNSGKSKSKYNNKKIKIDDILFDSQKEANYYSNLKLLKRSNKIIDFERQVRFILLDDFIHFDTKVRGISYYLDFKVYNLDGSIDYIDVKSSKSFQDPVYKLKKKLFHSRYNDIAITEVY